MAAAPAAGIVEGVDGRRWYLPARRSGRVLGCGRCGKPIAYGVQVTQSSGGPVHAGCAAGRRRPARSAPTAVTEAQRADLDDMAAAIRATIAGRRHRRESMREQLVRAEVRRLIGSS